MNNEHCHDLLFAWCLITIIIQTNSVNSIGGGWTVMMDYFADLLVRLYFEFVLIASPQLIHNSREFLSDSFCCRGNWHIPDQMYWNLKWQGEIFCIFKNATKQKWREPYLALRGEGEGESTGGAKVRIDGESVGDVGTTPEKRERIFIAAGEVIPVIASAFATAMT